MGGSFTQDSQRGAIERVDLYREGPCDHPIMEFTSLEHEPNKNMLWSIYIYGVFTDKVSKKKRVHSARRDKQKR